MAGCLIAYGAVLGKVSPVQLMVMTLFGITLFAVEEYIILDIIHVGENKYCLIFLIQLTFFFFCGKSVILLNENLILRVKKCACT